MINIDPVLDQQSRRDFMTDAARRLLGVSFLSVAGSRGLLAATAKPDHGGAAKRVIYLFMNGAMSQLDTFDPKQDANVQGETKVIGTNVPGVRVGEHLAKTATIMDRLALVRSLGTETGAHGPGQYIMRTGYKEIASTSHPSMGSWIQRLGGKGNRTLPGSVVVGADARHPMSGFLDAQYTPIPIADAAKGLQNSKSPRYLSERQFDRRMKLVESFGRQFRNRYKTTAVEAYDDLYQEAVRLLKSEDLKVFDLSAEPTPVRELYGSDRLGLGCLLARRLIERDVRFVEVNLSGWDFHRDLFAEQPPLVRQLDNALFALITDLEAKGLLNETLVVVATEFGRSPEINENAGRNHHPGAYSCVLAGGGTIGGAVFGQTDLQGKHVERDPVSVGDFNSTIAYAMGIRHDEEIMSPDGRPFTIGNGGAPLTKLFG